MSEDLRDLLNGIYTALIPPVRLTDVNEVHHEGMQRHFVRRGKFRDEVTDPFQALVVVGKPWRT